MALPLAQKLAANLPKGTALHIHHCSALPVSTDPIFVAPLGSKPAATELESHFLSASVKTETGLVQAFAIEVLVYTTEKLTTLFVSKADSTGYLHLLDAPRAAGSLIQIVIKIFLVHLVDSKRAPGRRLVLSLFARAQDQYLFPGSIENERKHVLDDRGLIKWWAKLVQKVIDAGSDHQLGSKDSENLFSKQQSIPRAYIVVPGCDKYETKAFVPRGANNLPLPQWHVGDPLRILGEVDDAPTRCLIPRFPDDPKARFAIDLDDELPEEKIENAPEDFIPPKTTDKWRSVRSLEQFWELMSFRQECSAGRLVGFLWAVWDPAITVNGGAHKADVDPQTDRETAADTRGSLSSPDASSSVENPPRSSDTSLDTLGEHLIVNKKSQQPVPQTQSPQLNSATGMVISDPPPVDVVRPVAIPPLVKTTPSDMSLAPDAYARCMAVMLTLDYCDLATAVSSTSQFLDAVAKEGGQKDCGHYVEGLATGQNEMASGTEQVRSTPNTLLQVRKRTKTEDANTLNIGLIRKKPKK